MVAHPGSRGVRHRNTGQSKIPIKSQNLIGWLDLFIHETGDFMPHKSEIHLPVGSLQRLYQLYLRYCSTRLPDVAQVCSYETLRRKFKLVSEYVKIPSTKMFTKCDECTRLELLEAEAKTNTLRRHAIQLRSRHNTWQFEERKV